MQVAYRLHVDGVWPVVAYILRHQASASVALPMALYKYVYDYSESPLTVTKLARKDWNIKF